MGMIQVKKKVVGDLVLRECTGAQPKDTNNRSVTATKLAKLRSCNSKMANPWLVLTVSLNISLANLSSKWWKARLKSRMSFLPSPRCTSCGGALAASTDVGSYLTWGLSREILSHDSRLGWMSESTKMAGSSFLLARYVLTSRAT